MSYARLNEQAGIFIRQYLYGKHIRDLRLTAEAAAAAPALLIVVVVVNVACK